MNITVYCGANKGNSERIREAAEELGRWIADNGHTMVYGGGSIGLMEVIADTVLRRGGEVIGVIPEFLMKHEKGHTGLHTLEIVPDMSTRKNRMMELGDAFIAMPGGTGTLEEITEAISLKRLRLLQKPIVFYNIDGYYDMMKPVFAKMVEYDFYPAEDLELVRYASDVRELENILEEETWAI